MPCDVLCIFISYSASLQDHRTALHWACSAGHTNIVQFLLDLGVEVNLQDDVSLVLSVGCWSSKHRLVRS